MAVRKTEIVVTTAALALVLMFVALAAPTHSGAATLTGVVPSSYEYSVRWDPESRRLTGKARIVVRNDGPGSRSTVWLRLRSNAGRRHERVASVTGARIAAIRAGGSMVELKLPRELQPGQTAAFGFRLALDVSRENTSLGHGAGIDTFGDALPVVAVAGGRGLRVGPEPAYGEGSLNATAPWRLRVQVPRGLRVALPGVTRSSIGRRSSSFSTTIRARDAAFAIGRLVQRSKLVNGIRVRVIGTRSTSHELDAALRRSTNAFRKMNRWYGHYDLPDLDVVLVKFDFGGAEYPGLVFSTPDNATVVHEIAHQWFYGLVGSDQFRDPWLDESITAFVENRFHKSYRCELARPLGRSKRGLSTGMDYWQRHPDAYVDTIYRGGACALTVLQQELGRATFDRALRIYVSENAGGIAETSDFVRAVREVAPGYDMSRWMRLAGVDPVE